MTSISDDELTRDGFLGGHLRLWQPKRGYRAGLDAVLLAASVPAKAGQTVLDLGCGVGAVGLCVAARVPDVRVMGVERNATLASIARRNGLETIEADIGDLPRNIKERSFDHVVMNPPYFDRRAGKHSTEPLREDARGVGIPLHAWARAGLRRVRPRGHLHVVHQIAALPAFLAPLEKAGSVTIQPLMPRSGKPCHLVLMRCQKDGRAPVQMLPPIVIHEGERYCDRVEAATRRGAALIW